MKKSIYCMVISGLMVSVAANGMFVVRGRGAAAGAGGRAYGYGGRYGQQQQRAAYGAENTKPTPQDLLNKMKILDGEMDDLRREFIFDVVARSEQLHLASRIRGPLENLKAFWPDLWEIRGLHQKKRDINKQMREKTEQYKSFEQQRNALLNESSWKE